MKKIVLAGATGDLGGRIAKSLVDHGAKVTSLVRQSTHLAHIEKLKAVGANPVEVDFSQVDQLVQVCEGASCVVSALNGLRDVIIDAQRALLDAAVKAGVPRFIPSDYSLDFREIPMGENRNFDLRREFQTFLEKAPIKATSIYNGAFMDMLTGQAPFILFKFKRVLYWESAQQKMDFTTKDDVAAYTALAAMDTHAPRALHIAGERVDAEELTEIVSAVRGERFKLLRAGSLARLEKLILLARLLSRDPDEVFPAWQGMQYMHNMFSGKAGLPKLDNDRYTELNWTKISEVIRQ